MAAEPKVRLELPNENPDIGKAGPVYNNKTIVDIPAGIAGIWHSHTKQGLYPKQANVMIPGKTFAMLVPLVESSVRILIRTDNETSSGTGMGITSFDTTVDVAMKFLNDNFTQTRFQG